jgi:lipid A 3-O-deacylase
MTAPTQLGRGKHLRQKLIHSAFLAGALALSAVIAPPAAKAADDPAFLSIGAGYLDWNRKKNTAAEFRAEYRSDKKLPWFKPLGGVMVTSDKSVYAFAGVGIDVYLGRRLVMTPSFAPGYYHKGSGLDLGHKLEFRSQLEIAYRFDNRARLGFAISHMSNASIGDINPGTESAMIYYSIPLGK